MLTLCGGAQELTLIAPHSPRTFPRAPFVCARNAAEKLGVAADSVQHGVEGLMYLLTEASKLMVRRGDAVAARRCGSGAARRGWDAAVPRRVLTSHLRLARTLLRLR